MIRPALLKKLLVLIALAVLLPAVGHSASDFSGRPDDGGRHPDRPRKRSMPAAAKRPVTRWNLMARGAKRCKASVATCTVNWRQCPRILTNAVGLPRK